jgi:hypothetical protein
MLSADEIIVQPIIKSKAVLGWEVLRQYPKKRVIVARILGNGPVVRELAVRTALSLAELMLVSQIQIYPNDYADEMMQSIQENGCRIVTEH